MRAWIHRLVQRVVQRQRNIIIMDDNYTRNGLNNTVGLKDNFWPHAVHTTVHIENIVILRKNNEKTPYEIWKGRPTNVKNLKVFGSKCYIKREYGRMEKFDPHVDNAIHVGYSSTRKAYMCYNMRLNKVMKTSM
jgi:hypothetical protein